MLDTTNDEGFQRELSRVAEAKREHQHLVVQKAAAAAEVEAASAEVEKRRDALIKEHDDVLRLQSMSVSRVFTSLRGERDANLRTELAEREAARVALLAAEERLLEAVRDLQTIDDRFAALGDVDAEWQRVVDARERWLAVTGEIPPAAAPSEPTSTGRRRLAELIERHGVLAAEEREVDEALAAAHLAAARLAHARSVLGSAHSWSTREVWSAGRPNGQELPVEKLDDVAAILRHVDLALSHLRRELADLASAGVPMPTFDGWDQTFDAFVDHLFTDVQVEERVRAAADAVHRLGQETASVIDRLTDHGRALEAEATTLAEERRGISAT